MSAAADLEMGILDQFQFMTTDIAVVGCAGNEDALAECSVTFRGAESPVNFAAVSCTGALVDLSGEMHHFSITCEYIKIICE